ncbi:MAG: AMP-binding protein [Burkholderiales bacterium]
MAVRPSPPSPERLLAVVDSLRQELRPGHHRAAALDSRLEHDLGFDSLARVELIARIEKSHGVKLSDEIFAQAETVRDLLHAIATACAGPLGAERSVVRFDESLAPVEGRPEKAGTLVEVLDWHARAHPDRTHVLFYATPDKAQSLTYGELSKSARQLAGGLLQRDLMPGQAVGIMLPTSLDFFRVFFAVLIAGGVPVPLYPPARAAQIEDHLRRQAGILANAAAPILITSSEAKAFSAFVKSRAGSLKQVLTPKELALKSAVPVFPEWKSAAVALLQYTSGSTGNPKGVVLTHANLLANIRAWSRAAELSSADVCVSWLPLYHDMGLIGTWLGNLYNAGLLVLMPPLDFLARPQRWLWAIHKHRGTVTAAPNFAFELCLRRIEDSDIEGLDLSSWRLAANGAEPVSPDTMERFIERFGKYGFRPETMVPVYGLAESTVGLTVPPLGRKPVIDHVGREAFLRTGQALPAAPGDLRALRFAACGRPLEGHAVRMMSPSGEELPERQVGRIEFRGPSATSGYFRNPEETRKLLHGDWLDTGDLGYFAGGDLYITSRVKDMIIRGGRNLYPYELEEAAGNLPGIRKGCVAVFGSLDPVAQTERLVVVAETREQESAAREALRARIEELSVELLGIPAEDIVLAPPHAVLKTSSGKIRRAATRERYEAGELALKQFAPWMGSLRIAAATFYFAAQSRVRNMAARAYAAYLWSVFAVLATLTVPIILLLPRYQWRWTAGRAGLRLLQRLAAIPVKVQGLDFLPRNDAYIVAANHASYLDGLVLVAALRQHLVFVAKRELRQSTGVRILFHALGVQYVERFDPKRGVEDTRRLSELAKAGQALAFFPEGTFRRQPGLGAFHMGAFVIAAETQISVVPVAIKGTRWMLPEGTWLPRRGVMEVTVSQALFPHGNDWDAALKLRDCAREKILESCGEPDLAS